MSTKFELSAETRDAKGKGASRRLRRVGKVPAILYGASKAPMTILLDHNQMMRHLDNDAFHTAILTVSVGGEKDQAILRDWQMHPYKPQIMHVDLQRISATEKLHMKVPLDVTCLPKDLPEFLEADLSGLHLNQSVHLSDIKLPEGVVITSLAHGGDNLAVAGITPMKVVEEVAPVVAVPAEGEAAAAAAAAPAAAEGEAKKAEGAKKPEAAAKGEAKKAEAPKKEGK